MVSVASNIQSYGDRTEADPYRQSSRSLGTVDARAYVSEWPDLSVGLLHVSCMLVYDTDDGDFKRLGEIVDVLALSEVSS